MIRRRVGTLTVGITLIMIGVMIPIALINTSIALKVLQFAPSVLIILGIEILYNALRHKGEKFSYDGLSIFLAIIITVGTVMASGIAFVLDKTVAFEEKSENIEDSIATALGDVDGDTQVAGVSVYTYLKNPWSVVRDTASYKIGATVNIDISEEATETQAEQIFFEAVNAVQKLELDLAEIQYTIRNNYNVASRNLYSNKSITLEDARSMVQWEGTPIEPPVTPEVDEPLVSDPDVPSDVEETPVSDPDAPIASSSAAE